MNLDAFVEKLNTATTPGVLHFSTQLRDLMAGFDLAQAITRQVRACQQSYRYTPPMVSNHGLRLASGTWFQLDLAIFEATEFNQTVVTHPSDALFYFASPAQFQLFRLLDYQNTEYNPASQIELDQTGKVAPGAIMALDASRQILNLQSDAPILVVTLSNQQLHPFGWKFDTHSGKPLAHYNTQRADTVLELMAKLLGAYGGDESLDCLKILLTHQNATVQWQAASAMAQIQHAAGVEAFTLLAASHNQALAQAAHATLHAAPPHSEVS